jgi:hypothetical protein
MQLLLRAEWCLPCECIKADTETAFESGQLPDFPMHLLTFVQFMLSRYA